MVSATVCEGYFQNDCPQYLLRSVFCVLAKYQREGKQPGAERWVTDTLRYRKTMLDDVIEEWAAIVGTDEFFPWTSDRVAHAWVECRKLKNKVKRELCAEFSIEVPDQWLARDDSTPDAVGVQ